MIKINLALRKQPSYVAGGAGGVLSGAPLTKILTKIRSAPSGALQDVPLAKVGMFVGLAIVVSVGLDQFESRAVDRVTQQLTAAQEKSKGLAAYASKVKEAEAIRATLAADTLLIRTKIDSIQKLMNERRSGVNLLLVLSDSVPADVWVTRFDAKPESVTIEGQSAGFGQVSDFIKKLSESTYLSDLNMERAVRDNVSPDVAQFRLNAKRRQP